MKDEKLENIEVRKVSNGYVVLPQFGSMDSQGFRANGCISVFETFDSLVTFLRKEFEPSQ